MNTMRVLTASAIAIPMILPITPSAATTYLIRLGGARIGTLERAVVRADSGRTVVRDRTEIRISRGGRSIEMGETLTWTEAAGSGLARFDAERTGFGPELWSDEMTRGADGWRRSRSRGGPSTIDTVPSRRLSGPTEIDRLFAASPDSMRIRTLDATSAEPQTYIARLVRADTLPSLTARVACRVYVLRDSSGTSPEVLQWRDIQGELWREVDPNLGWILEREELGSGPEEGPDLDVMRWISIPLEGKPTSGKPCTLLVEPLERGTAPSASPPIPDGVGQKLVPARTPGAWKILRSVESPRQGTTTDPARWRDDPTLADALRPGLIVDAGAAPIRAFAERAVAGSKTVTEEAFALERAVHDTIRTRDLGTVFGTASQTLRDGRGDCTEHAVLLAACCRARGIPARLVAGVVPNGRQMSFHLWTEAYIGRWIPLDATRGAGSVDPCAVALQRWTQPEDGLAGFQVTLERMTAGYRFRFDDEP